MRPFVYKNSVHKYRAQPKEKVRDVIEKNLLSEERNRLEKLWIDKLRKKTFVQYF